MVEHLIQTHPILLSVGGYFLFSSVVGGMPEPVAASGLAYRWAYTSLHLLAGNISVAIQNRYPQFTVPDGATAIHKETTVVVQPPSS